MQLVLPTGLFHCLHMNFGLYILYCSHMSFFVWKATTTLFRFAESYAHILISQRNFFGIHCFRINYAPLLVHRRVSSWCLKLICAMF